MALRRPCAAARMCAAKKVCLTVLAASTVSGVWPLAAKARSSVAELQKQLTTAEQQAQVATKRAEAAEQEVQEVKQQAQAAKQQAQAAKQQAKMRVWGHELWLALVWVTVSAAAVAPTWPLTTGSTKELLGLAPAFEACACVSNALREIYEQGQGGNVGGD
ncbi:hypothetical protein CHLRE_07g341100v5 [Chlamydomonas reinhardtii]|uniref:Uncharacterized protein n=1 Tax=Chlamydomonas reinhardtii TaxID=3055 RepID=A0A2K3DKP4_CHLRE|nr:uncharacterized protein CHLRE_07g341100v5 [Chlamydomonas reinhardtii]PNW81105.1 hypothetical protein CHLRE_07g341100v5 [Chlamydomonas reinhardtii]